MPTYKEIRDAIVTWAVAFIILAILIGLFFYAGGAFKQKDTKLKKIDAYAVNGEVYQYMIDEDTSVVYLLRNGVKGGITVMLNADGTPVTEDQLNNIS